MKMVPRTNKETGGDARVARFSPWIFRNEVDNFEELRGLCGSHEALLVNVENSEGRELGVAACNMRKGVNIVGRMLIDNVAAEVDVDHFASRVKKALQHRQQFLGVGANSFRVLHAEGDLVPGVVCDKYGDDLCVQFPSAAMETLVAEPLYDALQRVLSPQSIVSRGDLHKDREMERAPVSKPTTARGSYAGPTKCVDEGFKLEVDLLADEVCNGRVFEDRQLRALVGPAIARERQGVECAGRDPRVLSVFGDSIGVHCASLGAEVTFALQEDEPWRVPLLKRSAARNGCRDGSTKFTFVPEEPGTRALVEGPEGGFDIVTLEPPPFATTYGQVDEGMRKYTAWVAAAVASLRPQGLLLVVSRSRTLTPVRLLRCVNLGVWSAGRRAQTVHRASSGPPDFPAHMSLLDSWRMQSVLLRVA